MYKKIQALKAKNRDLGAQAEALAQEEGDNTEALEKISDQIEANKKQIAAIERAMNLSKANAKPDDDAASGGEVEDGEEETPDDVGGVKAGGRGGKVSSVAAFARAARSGFRAATTDPLAGTGNTLTDAEGGYTVPEDIRTRVESYRQSKASLRDLVSVESVTAPSGRRTFKKRSQQVGFAKVGEGGKIPNKGTPQFEVKNYSVSKYAGFFAVTRELLEDSDENITSTLVEWIGDEARVTDNKLILEAIQTKAAVDLADLAGIKKALYVTLDAAFRGTSSIVTNASGVFWLSQLKDGNGRELLTPVPSEPGRMQLAVGARVFPVHEYPDADLPCAEGKIPFILGDLKAGIRLFDRKVLTLTASNVAVAGTFNSFEDDLTLTRAIERLDVQQWDSEAYVYGYVDISASAEGGDDDSGAVAATAPAKSAAK